MNAKPEWMQPPKGGWRTLLRPGDWLTMLALLALIVYLTSLSWNMAGATHVRVYQDGKLLGEYDLNITRRIITTGPLGQTVVEIAGGRVRIAQDPSPRQYCVKAGWLTTAGQVAICLPNRTSIELRGTQTLPYDSLSF